MLLTSEALLNASVDNAKSSYRQLCIICCYAGAGDRLGLKDPISGEGLPVAVLPYCGRPLLESLIRDVQAREYLYYKLLGLQQMTPIAIMTSDA